MRGVASIQGGELDYGTAKIANYGLRRSEGKADSFEAKSVEVNKEQCSRGSHFSAHIP